MGFRKEYKLSLSGILAVEEIPWYLSGGISAASIVAAYQPKGASSLANSYINIANPGTYDAVPGVAPTWAAGTGWTFAATNWLDTGIVPGLAYTAVIRYSGAVVGDRVVIGALEVSPTRRFDITPIYLATNVLYGYSGSVSSRAPQLAAGVLAIAGGQPYRDGSIDGSPIAAGTMPTVAFAIGARRRTTSTVDSNFIGSVQAVTIYSATLTTAQVAAVTTAMQAL